MNYSSFLISRNRQTFIRTIRNQSDRTKEKKDIYRVINMNTTTTTTSWRPPQTDTTAQLKVYNSLTKSKVSLCRK
jgi:hypothetical protein